MINGIMKDVNIIFLKDERVMFLLVDLVKMGF